MQISLTPISYSTSRVTCQVANCKHFDEKTHSILFLTVKPCCTQTYKNKWSGHLFSLNESIKFYPPLSNTKAEDQICPELINPPPPPPPKKKKKKKKSHMQDNICQSRKLDKAYRELNNVLKKCQDIDKQDLIVFSCGPVTLNHNNTI